MSGLSCNEHRAINKSKRYFFQHNFEFLLILILIDVIDTVLTASAIIPSYYFFTITYLPVGADPPPSAYSEPFANIVPSA